MSGFHATPSHLWWRSNVRSVWCVYTINLSAGGFLDFKLQYQASSLSPSYISHINLHRNHLWHAVRAKHHNSTLTDSLTGKNHVSLSELPKASLKPADTYFLSRTLTTIRKKTDQTLYSADVTSGAPGHFYIAMPMHFSKLSANSVNFSAFHVFVQFTNTEYQRWR